MKIFRGGRDWEWTDERFDQSVLDRERQMRNSGNSIWDTRGCNRCGACCYYLEVSEIRKPAYTKCDHLITTRRGASCELHGDDKPESCKVWTCYNRLGLESPAQRYLFARIAVDVLGTKSEGDIKKLGR